jgi:hypothetical protein
MRNGKELSCPEGRRVKESCDEIWYENINYRKAGRG